MNQPMKESKKTSDHKTLSKSDLCRLYGISITTLRTWLVVKGQLFTIEYYNKTKIFNPKEVSKIFSHLGEP